MEKTKSEIYQEFLAQTRERFETVKRELTEDISVALGENLVQLFNELNAKDYSDVGLRDSINYVFKKKVNDEFEQAKRKLPLYCYKKAILKLLENHQCLVLSADTGTGKTTQLPQYLNNFNQKNIICTQPRKLPTLTSADRVGFETGCQINAFTSSFRVESTKLDSFVNYFSEVAFLNYLLKQISNNNYLESVSVLIIDEAHERSLECDIILGLVKKYLLPNRPDLKVIISSATVNQQVFSEFLQGCPVLECRGKTYPIEYHYLSKYDDYFVQLCNTTKRVIEGKLRQKSSKETILVFLPGIEEIKLLEKNLRVYKNIEVKILHGRVSAFEQRKIISPGKFIKVVISTNVAESSLTVPNVTVVIDSGREKSGRFASRVSDMRIQMVSKMSAIQRGGRCGRVQKGDCYRIYTLEEYQEMPDFKTPAIMNSNLSVVLLKFIKYNILRLDEFPFIDRPSVDSLEEQLKELLVLGAISKTLEITDLGEYVLKSELDPDLVKMIYHAINIFGCGDDCLTIACGVKTCNYIFQRIEEYQVEEEVSNLVGDMLKIVETSADQTKLALNSFFARNYLLDRRILQLGDFMTLLFAIRQFSFVMCQICFWEGSEPNSDCSYCSKRRIEWCRKHEVDYKSFKNCINLKRELINVLNEGKLFSSKLACSTNEEFLLANLCNVSIDDKWYYETEKIVLEYRQEILDLDKVLESIMQGYSKAYKEVSSAICSGLFKNFCQFRGGDIIDNGYMKVYDKEAFIVHPGSPYLFSARSSPPEFVIFYEKVISSRRFMKFVNPVDLEMLKKQAGSWLLHFDFQETSDLVTSVKFENFGPALVKKITGKNGTGLAEVESILKQKGIPGSLVFIDYESNSLNLTVPGKYQEPSKEAMQSIIEDLKKEVIKENTVRVPYCSGLVLVVAQGGLIKEILNSDQSLCYKIEKLKDYKSWQELHKDISNTFEFQHMVMFKERNFTCAKVYFESEEQAQKASVELLKSPLPGVYSSITSMSPVKFEPVWDGVSLQLSIPSRIDQNEVLRVIELCGELAEHPYIAVKPGSTFIKIKYRNEQAAEDLLNCYKFWAQERIGTSWQASIEKIEKGFEVPKEVLEIPGLNFEKFLRYVNEKYNCGITYKIRTKHILFNEREIPEEALNEVIKVLECETINCSQMIYKQLEFNFLGIRKEVTYSFSAWQEHLGVNCKFSSSRSVLSIFGLPPSRVSAKAILSEIITSISQEIYTKQISFRTHKEFKIIQNSKFLWESEYKVDILPDAKRKVLTIQGFRKQVNKFLENVSFTRTIADPNKNCAVCYDNITDENKVKFVFCGHTIHLSCFAIQIKCAIKEKPFPQIPVKCVYCNSPVLYEDWTKVFTPTLATAFYKAGISTYMSNPKVNKFWCENPDCDYVYELNFQSIIRKCPECKMKFCIKCKKRVLLNTHENRCEFEQLQGSLQETRDWIAENTKECPECAFRVEKSSGCNHMTCPKCNVHYCFLCTEPINKYSPVDHFSNPETPCYHKYMADPF